MDRLGKGSIVRPEDVETLGYDWGTIRLLSEPKLTGAERMTCGLVELAPGKGHDRHNHPGTEEIIYVISGHGEQMVDDGGTVKVGPGASIFVPTGAYHSTLNTGRRTMRLLVIYCPTGTEKTLRAIPGVKVVRPRKKAKTA
jgi:oxalate decarboxylase/phosphoglucose isomerase-like protein (cupin superfamily)